MDTGKILTSTQSVEDQGTALNWFGGQTRSKKVDIFCEYPEFCLFGGQMLGAIGLQGGKLAASTRYFAPPGIPNGGWNPVALKNSDKFGFVLWPGGGPL